MYDASKIYTQIEKAWKSKGCSNAKQFCEFAKEKGYFFSEQTISRWKHGSIPNTQLLLDICNVCGCDISYLIGNVHSNTDYGISYINERTGLSESAIDMLCNRDLLSNRDLLIKDYPKLKDKDISGVELLSFLIENGLIKELSHAQQELYRIVACRRSIQNAPKRFRKIIEDAIAYHAPMSITYKVIETLTHESIESLITISESAISNTEDYYEYSEDDDDHLPEALGADALIMTHMGGSERTEKIDDIIYNYAPLFLNIECLDEDKSILFNYRLSNALSGLVDNYQKSLIDNERG